MFIHLTGIFLLIALSPLSAIPLHAQKTPGYDCGLKLNANGREDTSPRSMGLSQVWVAVTKNSPGTLAIDHAQNTPFDIRARRLQMLDLAQLSTRACKIDKALLQPFFTYTRISLNSQTTVDKYWKIDGQRGALTAQSPTFL